MKETSHSDDEFMPTSTQKSKEDVAEIKPEVILNYVREKDLDFSQPDSSEIATFCSKFTDSLNRQKKGKQPEGPGHILHLLAEQSATEGSFANYWTQERLKHFLRWFFKHHWTFLEIPNNRKSHFPLHTAFMARNHVFIRVVLDDLSSEKLKKVLVQKTSGRNYIQVAYLACSPLLEVIAEKCTKLSLPVWRGSMMSGKESESPLHVAVKSILSKQTNESLQHQPLDEPVKQPFMKWIDSVQERRKRNGNSDNDMIASPNDIADLLISLIEDFQKGQDPISQVDVVKLFIRSCETALEHQSIRFDETRTGLGVEIRATPYQERIAQLRNGWEILTDAIKRYGISIKPESTSDKAFRRVVIEDPVADTIRYHCLRYFKRDKTTQCLYQPGDGKSRLIMGLLINRSRFTH